MVLDYLQRVTFFHDGPPAYGAEAKNPPYEGGGRRRLSKSSPPQSLLSPVARILRDSAGAVNQALLQVRDGLTEEQRTAKRKLEEQKQIFHLRLKNAQTFDEWKSAAQELDRLEDNEGWKREKESSDFDALLVEARLKQLDEARTNCDVARMLSLVRTSLARDLGGISNIRLYRHSHTGTKDLIERYIDSTVDTIRALVKTSAHRLPAGLDTKDILEQVVYARQAFGRSALLLSGGATFGMNHVGVLKALFDAQLLPRIISGASAGSIVCAVLCTRTDEEIPEVLRTFPHGDLAVFEEKDNEDGLLERIGRFLTQGAWIDMKHLVRVMQALLGDMTFQEAYNRTRRILNICVSSASIYELPRLLNYVTSPNVMIWSAVAASCSVPLLFSPAHLLVKNPITGEHLPWNPTPQHWIDGSVDNDLPMTRLAEMFNVNHFIVSQVNPHVVPFLAKDDAAITHDSQSPSSTTTDWLFTLTNLAKGEALHRMQVLADLGIFPNLVTKARSVLSQKYSGDITILPEIYYRDFPRMLKNPTAEFMVQACLCGERATWPKMSRIRNHCAVELELDSAVKQLRARVVFSPSQVDLRRLHVGQPSTVGRGTNGTRRRRVSGSNAFASKAEDGAQDGAEEDIEKMRKGLMTRPALRASVSHFGFPAPGDSAPLFTAPIHPPSNVSPTTILPSIKYAHLTGPKTTKKQANQRPKRDPAPENFDLTSDAETTEDVGVGFASSDADVDSHTDDSSPEPDTSSNDYLRLNLHRLRTDAASLGVTTSALGHTNRPFGPSQASFFSAPPHAGLSASQPATPSFGPGMGFGTGYHKSLALNATTPPSSVVGTPVLLSPELIMTPSAAKGRGRPLAKGASIGSGPGGNPGDHGDEKDISGAAAVREQSSPERKYKRLFHGSDGGVKG